MYFTDPLEQFDIIPTLKLWMNITVTNLNIFLIFNLILISLFLFFSLVDSYFILVKNSNKTFNMIFYIIFKMYELLVMMLKENISVKKKSLLIIFLFLFMFLLVSNLIGMIPFSYTVTSSLIVTFFISFSFFFGLNLMGFFYNQSNFFSMFLPSGTPIFIAPLLILIEFVSYFSSVFSLAIRLFANMMSGHALLKILISFSWTALMSNDFFFKFFAPLPWLVVTFVIGLELAIAGLQAYVFTILMCIYFNDACNPH